MIQSPLLNPAGSFIHGKWQTDGNKRFEVINPANGNILASLPDVGHAGAQLAAESAAAVMRTHPMSMEARRQHLEIITAGLTQEREALAQIITAEQGKPLEEARGEVDYARGFFEYAAAHLDQLAPRIDKKTVRDCHWQVHFRPAGVVALITPWNFPLAMLAKKLATAIAAGCAVVVKPSSSTPLSTIALWNLFIPKTTHPDFFQLVLGSASEISRALLEHPEVRVISFTGSTAIGKKLISGSASGVKRLTLELGGNAPFIVLEDADTDAAVAGLIASKFRCAGQTCVCANRVFVHEKIAETFFKKLEPAMAQLRVGPGDEEGVTIGPLIHADAWNDVHELVEDAVAQGAELRMGAHQQPPTHSWGAFYAPTLLCNVPPDARIFQEEIFGPVVAVQTFTNVSDVILAANDTPYGLAAYIYSQNKPLAEEIAGQLHFGHIAINSGTGPAPQYPFGGMKQSGYGREGGKEGLFEFIEIQAVASAEIAEK